MLAGETPLAHRLTGQLGSGPALGPKLAELAERALNKGGEGPAFPGFERGVQMV